MGVGPHHIAVLSMWRNTVTWWRLVGMGVFQWPATCILPKGICLADLPPVSSLPPDYVPGLNPIDSPPSVRMRFSLSLFYYTDTVLPTSNVTPFLLPNITVSGESPLTCNIPRIAPIKGRRHANIADLIEVCGNVAFSREKVGATRWNTPLYRLSFTNVRVHPKTQS